MKKYFLLYSTAFIMLATLGGCAVKSDYCCTSNDQCVPVDGKDTFCTTAECGQCEAPDQPLQITVNWKDAVVGKPYEVELTASGGFSPYDWVNFTKVNDNENKLAWLVLEKDPNKPENAYLRNGTYNDQPVLPSKVTSDTDQLMIEVAVQDNTRHGDSGVVFSHPIKINICEGECTGPQPLGSSCKLDGDCASGHCAITGATGVCCVTACNGICQACGADGQCSNLMPEDDPNCGTIDCSGHDTECSTYPPLTAKRCASFGVCKDASYCTEFTNTDDATPCAGGKCWQGTCSLQGTCACVQTCAGFNLPPKPPTCGPVEEWISNDSCGHFWKVSDSPACVGDYTTCTGSCDCTCIDN